MRRSIYSLLLSSSLLLLPSLAEARTLSPLSDWSVNKVNVAQGDSYCTMARQYQTNAIITFARNVTGEGTIALDFQRNVFDIARSYPVTLQAGSVLRQYVIKPASNTAVIMRTSTDASLFEAMQQSGSLRVQIDSENFTVDLKDYAQGMAKLNNCIGGGASTTVVAVDERPQPRPPQASGEATEDVNIAVNQRDSELEELVNENARLVRELESERVSFRERLAEASIATPHAPSVPQGEVSSARETTEALKKLADAENQNNELLRRISVLEERLAKTESSVNPDLSAVLAEREDQIALLSTEKQRLQTLLDQERAQKAALESDMIAMTQRNSSEDDNRNTLIANLENKVASLTQQNDDLKTRLAQIENAEPEVIVKEVIREVPIAASGDVSGDILALNEQLAEAQTQSLSLKAERDEYRALLQRERQRQREISDLGQSVSDSNVKTDNMILEIKQLEAEKVDLMRQLEFAKSGAQNVEAQEDGLLQSRLEEVKRESDDAKSKLRELASEKKLLEDKLRLAEIEAEKAKRALSEAKVTQIAEGEMVSGQDDIKTLEAEIAALEAQNRVLREDMAARSVSQSNADDTAALIASIEEKYKARLEAVENENIRLTRALNDQAEDMPRLPAVDIAEADISESIDEVAVENASDTVIISTQPKQKADIRVAANEARKKLRQRILGDENTQKVQLKPAMVQEPTAVASTTQALTDTQPTVPKVQPVSRAEIEQEPVDLMQAVSVQPQIPATPTPVAQAPQMEALSGDEIRRLVSQSRIPLVTNVERVTHVSGPDFAAFRWDTGQVFGSAEQSRLASNAAFDSAITQYITKTQNRCGGEFDQTVTPIPSGQGLNARAVDIACVQGSEGAAASIVFFTHNGMFYALAHETDLNGFEVAMDHRDRLVNSLSALF
jgi:hypothetical protein